jgi:hypothetical protein
VPHAPLLASSPTSTRGPLHTRSDSAPHVHMDTDDDEIMARAKRLCAELHGPSPASTFITTTAQSHEEAILERARAIAATHAPPPSTPVPVHPSGTTEDPIMERARGLLAAQDEEDSHILSRAAMLASFTPDVVVPIGPSVPSSPPVMAAIGADGRIRFVHASSSSAPRAHADALPARTARQPSRVRPPAISEREAEALKPILEGTDVAPSDEAQVKEAEIGRCLALMNASMVASVTNMSTAELDAIAAARALSREDIQLRLIAETFRKSSVSQLRCARYAVQRLQDFAASIGIESPDLDYSTGFLSIFFSGQLSPSMPATLVRGLQWAQDHMGSKADAKSPFLAPFLKRYHGGSHARTWPPIVCLRLERMAAGGLDSACASPKEAEYLSAVASGLCTLFHGSLRWHDAQHSQLRRVATDAIDGYAPTTKTGPMHWWAEVNPFGEWATFHEPMTQSLAGLGADTGGPTFLFRRASFTSRAHQGDPAYFTGWAHSAAPKAHVLRGYRRIMELDGGADDPPLPQWLIRLALRLHGARRVYPTAARFLSGELGLTADDRDELGRWAPSGNAERGAARPMSNVYSTDAARHRCVETRTTVASAVRARLRALAAAGGLTADTTWDFLVSSTPPTIPAIEPDMDSMETADDADAPGLEPPDSP